MLCSLQEGSFDFKAFYGDGTSRCSHLYWGHIKRSSQEQTNLSQLVLVSTNDRLITCRIGWCHWNVLRQGFEWLVFEKSVLR